MLLYDRDFYFSDLREKLGTLDKKWPCNIAKTMPAHGFLAFLVLSNYRPKIHSLLHQSMQILNADSMHVFSFQTNQKRGQYDFSKFLELISFVLF